MFAWIIPEVAGGLLILGSEALVRPILQKPWEISASSQIKHTSDGIEAGCFFLLTVQSGRNY